MCPDSVWDFGAIQIIYLLMWFGVSYSEHAENNCSIIIHISSDLIDLCDMLMPNVCYKSASLV